MKKFLSIALITIALCSCRKYIIEAPLTSHSMTACDEPNMPLSPGMKNIQPIVDLNAYEAFGVSVENKPTIEITHYYARGLTHTTGYKFAYRTFDELTGAVSGYTIVRDSVNGVSGGKMDNDSTVLFETQIHADGTRDIWIQKVDANHNFSTPVLFDWSVLGVKLTGGFFFGDLIYGDVAGEFYHIIYQVGSGRYRASLVKTNDYWNTYHEVGVIYDGPNTYTEFAGVNLSNGKFLAVSRNNVSGGLIEYESTNYGITWLRRGPSNLYWWNGGNSEIPYIHAHDGVFDIFYECRDAFMMQISKNNTLANFGNTSPTFNVPEIYSYHKGVGGNPSLGYGCELKLADGRYFTIYSKEYTTTRANLQWTYDDLVTDPNGIPINPPIKVSAITSTSFRIDIQYSDTVWQNVRYLSMDLSTDSTFSSFVTCKYRSVSTYPAVPIHDIRVTGPWDIFNVLTTNTTYYLRIKGVNNAGSSPYTNISVKTL